MGEFERRNGETDGKTSGKTKKYFSYAAAEDHSLKGRWGLVRGRTHWLAAGVLALGAVIGGVLWRLEESVSAAAPAPAGLEVRWIVDAGHGGEDGGAVSPGGVVESRINLEIARRVDGIFGFCGEPALMLRTEDISIHDPEAVSLREKKASDLHNRAQTASEYPEAALVSIHQNMFQQSRYRGTQVFYAPTQGSQELAQAIQWVVRESLQPENSRWSAVFSPTQRRRDCFRTRSTRQSWRRPLRRGVWEGAPTSHKAVVFQRLV